MQDDEWLLMPRREPKKHSNLYLSHEAHKKLDELKQIVPDKQKLIERIRRAAEAEIDRVYRVVKAISGK